MTDLLKKTGPSLSERTTEDFAIPYLNIIGDTSPQIDKEDSEYIPGAEAGMISIMQLIRSIMK